MKITSAIIGKNCFFIIVLIGIAIALGIKEQYDCMYFALFCICVCILEFVFVWSHKKKYGTWYYRHFKGDQYLVWTECAMMEKDGEEMVVYQNYEDPDAPGYGLVWIRPRKEFFETVTLADGTIVDRFRLGD